MTQVVAPVSIDINESSVSLTNHGKIRKRISKACNYCRQRKIKCDGNPTKCINCTNHSIECIYSKSARKKKSKGIKKPSKKMSLGDLQKKVEDLEDSLTDLNKKVSKILQILSCNNLKLSGKDSRKGKTGVVETDESDDSEYDEYQSEEEEYEEEGSEVEFENEELQQHTPRPTEKPVEKIERLDNLTIPNFETKSLYNQFSPISSVYSVEDSLSHFEAAPTNIQSIQLINNNQVLSPHCDSISSSSTSVSTLGAVNNYTPNFLLDSNINLNTIKYESTLNDINRIDEQLNMINNGLSVFYKNDQFELNTTDVMDPFGNIPNTIQ